MVTPGEPPAARRRRLAVRPRSDRAEALASDRAAPAVSVLTAGWRLKPSHLRDAYCSLLAQSPAWEWVIQIDGRARALPTWLARDRRVHVAANGDRYGAAITRNRALARCRAELVQNLDDDDVLAYGALALLSAALERYPPCAFAFGDSFRAGLPVAHGRRRAPRGVLAPRVLFERWQNEGLAERGLLPLAPGGVMWRREVLLAEGGWRALSGCEDTALLMSVAERHPAIGVGVPTIGVREHALRITRTAAFRDAKDQHWELIRRQVIAQRRLAAREFESTGRRAPSQA